MDLKDGYSLTRYDDGLSSMSLFEVREDEESRGQPAFKGRKVDKNVDKLTKPFASPAYSGHFNFSHGKFLLDAGYDT